MAGSVRSHSARIQLVLIRSLLERAEYSVDGSDVGSMSALLFADLAVETALKAALVEKNAEFPRGATLPQLLDTLENEYPSLAGTPEIGMTRRLRDARNPVQHSAATVGPATLDALLADSRTIVNALFRTAFGVHLDEVSIVSLVGDPTLRTALEKAQELSASGNLDDAVLLAVAVFESLRIRLGRWVRKAMGVSEALDGYGPWVVSREVLEVFGAEHGHATEPVGDWREWVQFAIGIPLRDQVVLRHAKARCDAVRKAKEEGAEPPPSDFGVDDVIDLIEVTARNVWRLEATQPGTFFERP
jgi:hypothetical protein